MDKARTQVVISFSWLDDLSDCVVALDDIVTYPPTRFTDPPTSPDLPPTSQNDNIGSVAGSESPGSPTAAVQDSHDDTPQPAAAVEQARNLAASALDSLNSQTQTHGPSADTTSSATTAPATARMGQKYKRPVRGPRTTWTLSDGTRAQYCQLIDYPLADSALPAGTTCLDIATHYPNHFCGENLEAFLQYFWTAEMIVKYIPNTVKSVLIAQGIHREGSTPANFIRNRLDTYTEKVLGAAGLRRLLADPKQRPSGLPAGEEYGRANPLGLGLNPTLAPTTRAAPRKLRTMK